MARQTGMIQVLNPRQWVDVSFEPRPHWKCNNTPSNWQETAFSGLTDDDFHPRAAIMKILPINPDVIHVYWKTGKYDHDLSHTNDQSISRFGYKFTTWGHVLRRWELKLDWILYTAQIYNRVNGAEYLVHFNLKNAPLLRSPKECNKHATSFLTLKLNWFDTSFSSTLESSNGFSLIHLR